MVSKGIEQALEMYQPVTNTWSQVNIESINLCWKYLIDKFYVLQSHCQARFVISRVLLEAGDDLLTVTETVPNDRLHIKLNRENIYTKGAEAIRNFLLKLQVRIFLLMIKIRQEIADQP